MRSLMSPTFTSGKIKQMMPLMQASLNILSSNLEKVAGNEAKNEAKAQDFNAKKVFGALTLDVFAKTAFATDTNAQNDDLDSFALHVARFVDFGRLKVVTSLLLPDCERFSQLDKHASRLYRVLGQHCQTGMSTLKVAEYEGASE